MRSKRCAVQNQGITLMLKLGIKYSLTTNFGYKVYHGFLNFAMSFSMIFGIFEGLFQVYWYSSTPKADPE